MLWINRADAPQLRQKLVCDHGWPMVLHAVDDAVCDSRDGIKSVLPLQEGDEDARRLCVVGRGNGRDPKRGRGAVNSSNKNVARWLEQASYSDARSCQMTTFNQSPPAIRLQHRRELLLAEREFLKGKMDFVKKSLQGITAELSKLKNS